MISRLNIDITFPQLVYKNDCSTSRETLGPAWLQSVHLSVGDINTTGHISLYFNCFKVKIATPPTIFCAHSVGRILPSSCWRGWQRDLVEHSCGPQAGCCCSPVEEEATAAAKHNTFPAPPWPDCAVS